MKAESRAEHTLKPHDQGDNTLLERVRPSSLSARVATAAGAAALFVSGCANAEQANEAQQHEQDVIAAEFDPAQPEEANREKGDTYKVQVDVYPGIVVVPGNVNQRQHPEVINGSESNGMYSNEVEEVEGATAYDRPIIAFNEEGDAYIGALPDNTDQWQDYKWVLLRQDTMEQLELWGDDEESVQFHEVQGLNAADSVTAVAEKGTRSLSMEDGRPLARSYPVDPEGIHGLMAERGYAPVEAITSTFDPSWEQ